MEPPRQRSDSFEIEVIEEPSRRGIVGQVPSEHDRQEISRESTSARRFVVPVVFTIFVFNRALDRVFLNRALKTMGVYQSALMNLYWPIMVQCMTIAITIGYVCKKRFGDKDIRYGLAWLSPWNPAASAAGRVPLRWMATFAAWDQLNALIQAVAQAYISNAMQVAINNTVVIWTLVIAFFYLGARFHQVHYAACLLIVMACIVGVVVELQDGTLPKPANASGLPVDVSAGTMLLMYCIFSIGVIPQGVSNCYKQKVLKGVDLDVMWASLWSGMFQVMWGILGYTSNWIPYPVPGGYNDASPKTLGSDLSDAWICFTGSNPHPGNLEGATCTTDSAWLWFIVYLIFNVTFNLILLWLTKHLSATWASIGNVLCGDLYGVFGQFSFINGSGSKWLPLEQWLALVLSSIAMWIYNIEDEMDSTGKSVYGVQSKDDSKPEPGNVQTSDRPCNWSPPASPPSARAPPLRTQAQDPLL